MVQRLGEDASPGQLLVAAGLLSGTSPALATAAQLRQIVDKLTPDEVR